MTPLLSSNLADMAISGDSGGFGRSPLLRWPIPMARPIRQAWAGPSKSVLEGALFGQTGDSGPAPALRSGSKGGSAPGLATLSEGHFFRNFARFLVRNTKFRKNRTFRTFWDPPKKGQKTVQKSPKMTPPKKGTL